MEGDLQKTFGRNLRKVRQSKGLSQEQFAEVIGVHRTYMGGVERGERNLTLKSVERIAARINLDPLSLHRLDENQLVIDDATFTGGLADAFVADCARARQVVPAP